MPFSFEFSDEFDLGLPDTELPPVESWYFPTGIFGATLATPARKTPRKALLPAWRRLLEQATTERTAVAAIEEAMRYGDEATQVTMVKEIAKDFPYLHRWHGQEDEIHTLLKATEVGTLRNLGAAAQAETALALLGAPDTAVYVVMDGSSIPAGKKGILYIVNEDEVDSILGKSDG